MQSSRRQQLIRDLRAAAWRHDWAKLIASYGTPLLVLDPGAVVAAYRELSIHLPGFDLHYAVKALAHPAVITAIASCGGGFDVATRAEVELVRALGVAMDKTIHTNPVKKLDDIDHAYQAGIRTFVVDNPVEAQKFCGQPSDIRVLVRLSFPNATAKSDLSTKFGVDMSSYDDAELLVKQVLASGVMFAGFSFHVGSQSYSVEPFRCAMTSTLDLCRHIRDRVGVETTVIDIGGGFPVPYREPVPTVAQIAEVINDTMGALRAEFTLIAEPGRFLAAPCMTLFTSVVGTATRSADQWHYLDDGLYGSYSNVLCEDVHPPILAWRELITTTSELLPVTLAGPTCDSVDVIARGYPMPQLAMGDVVVSPMMGAYTAVTATSFNGLESTPIVVTEISTERTSLASASRSERRVDMVGEHGSVEDVAESAFEDAEGFHAAAAARFAPGE
jgi:ornithine decarboxylase